MSNTLGQIFKITSFGESHGRCVGIVVDGCPAGLTITEAEIQAEADRRKPGSVLGGTPRAEEDKVEILSGVFNGFTTGAPITMLAWNKESDSSNYDKNRFLPRPGHADYTAFVKYGGFSDYRGGGRFSGRITAGFVMAGAIAKKLLMLKGIEVGAHTVEIGGIRARPAEWEEIREIARNDLLHCADPSASKEMADLIARTAAKGDSVGGMIECLAVNLPAGLGEPVFDTLEGELAKAMLAIPAVKGVEFGAGFEVTGRKGSANNDAYRMQAGKIITTTNNAGGITGGISNGMPIVLRVAVKPTPSITIEQDTVNLSLKENAKISTKGRHDACIVPRAVVVVEAMTAITLCDFALRAGMIPGVIR